MVALRVGIVRTAQSCSPLPFRRRLPQPFVVSVVAAAAAVIAVEPCRYDDTDCAIAIVSRTIRAWQRT